MWVAVKKKKLEEGEKQSTFQTLSARAGVLTCSVCMSHSQSDCNDLFSEPNELCNGLVHERVRVSARTESRCACLTVEREESRKERHFTMLPVYVGVVYPDKQSFIGCKFAITLD